MAASTLSVLVVLAVLATAFPSEISGSAAAVLDVAGSNGARTFASLARKCVYLKELLDKSTEPFGYTVFAFSDRAYDQAPAAFKRLVNDTQRLQWAMEYHVSLGPTFSQDIKDNLLITSVYPSPTSGAALPLQYIRTNVYTIYAEQGNLGSGFGKVVTAGGSQIIKADLIASNGIVHIIDKVMFPVPTGSDMAEYLHLDGRFSSLYMYLKKANLTTALETDASRPLTIFAPSNEAFASLSAAVKEKLKNKAFLQDVLEYHVVKGAFYAVGLYDNQSLMPLNGKRLLVQRGPGGVYVQDSKVIQIDNTVTNGVVHEISTVLIPPK